MSNTHPTRAPRVTDAQRAAEAEALGAELTKAIAAAVAVPSDPSHAEAAREAWVQVATYAGNVQRRARLLAGLGRGG
ncbi:MAG: hypothetical protein JWR63_1065 [Conexibacter sp.]|nr:hypothetical protein [Conexibacter sp.]